MTGAQQALQIARPTWRLDRPRRDQLAILLFLLLAVLFLFGDTRVPPVALQDEARNAVNAIEMHVRGYSLITTFNFQPDLWNTKPPLLIWLMTASMNLFGPSEWSLRLPAALAAMGTLGCTLWFVRRVTGSFSAALAAASLLLISPGFFGEHGARTADYDGPLALFVTAGLQLLFFAVHRTRPRLLSMFAIGGLIASAALTKSIAAFIPVTGVLLYLAAIRRFPRVLSQWQRYAVAAALAVAPLLTFYALREAAGPGYLKAVLHNDILGRFSETMIEPTSPLYYVGQIFLGWFVAGPFLLAAPLAMAHCSPRERLLFIYSAAIVGASLLVFSAASNRAVQYALPMFPWLSIMAVLTLRYLVRVVVTSWRGGKTLLAIALGATLVMVGGQVTYRAAYWRYQAFPERQFYAQSSYGDLFAALSARGVTAVTVVDPGVRHLGIPGYAPLLHWNALIWRERGMTIRQEQQQRAEGAGPFASCEPTVFNRWSGPAVEHIGRCAVLWRAVEVARRTA